MHKQILKTAAPMPKAQEDIKNNSMKLFAYLMCIAGLADYPENTRMFRQKNLILTQIKNATGITDKTVKLYLYYLEENGLIKYNGEHKFNFLKESDFNTFSEYRLAAQQEAMSTWKMRQKVKDSVYYIPRPWMFTPVPEITLERLNKDFQITELELDIYLFCCKYRDECVKNGKSYKAMTYEQFRDILGLQKHSITDKSIFSALCFLEKLGLISFSIGYSSNSKMAKIPYFKITEVGYYINQQLVSFVSEEILNETEQKALKEMQERINLGYEKMNNRECSMKSIEKS